MPVPSSDRVLIHLLERGEPKGWTGGVSDQDMIASKCGIGRTHVPRVIKPLIETGKIMEDLGRSPGRQRRVKVYMLSDRGHELAQEVLVTVNSMKVPWKDEDGKQKEGTVEESLGEINERLRSLSMEPVPLSLFLSLPIEDLSWNDIIWTSSSLPKEARMGPMTPNGWRTFHLRDRIDGMSFSKEMLEKIDSSLIEVGKILIKGPGGSGKRDLIDLWTRSRSKKVLWLEKGKGEEGIRLEGGPWDAIVLIGGGDPGVESLLMEDLHVKDPRGNDWPEELKKLDLLMTTDVKVEIEGPVMEIEGLSEDLFLEICRKTGLNDDLSLELFGATKGSSRCMRFIAGLSDEDVEEMNGVDVGDGVMRVLLSIKK